MYKLYCKYLKKQYGDKCKLLFTDADTFCCHIEKDDLYEDLRKNLLPFNRSNFEPTQPLYWKTNKNSSGDEIVNVNFYAMHPEALFLRHNPSDRSLS